MTSLADLSLAAASAALAMSEVSPVELTEACLARADRWEPAIDSLTCRLDERALAEAREAEREIAAGWRRGPLHGIPITIKDLVDVAGVSMEAGSRLLAGNVPTSSAHVAEQAERAGTVLLGKARTHEFAWGGTTPPTRNPWDRARIPGGSSGGSGAAVAAGIGYASIASDTAGSVRSPASYNGVVGLKPTYGRIGRSGLVPLAWSLDTVGVLARTVEDAALLYDALAGPDARDVTSIPTAAEPAAPLLAQGVTGLRVGVIETLFETIQTDVEERQRAAIDCLADAGAIVRPIVLEPADAFAAALPAAFALCAAESAAWHGDWLDTRADAYADDVYRHIMIGRHLPASAYLDAQRIRRLVTEAFSSALDQVDLLVAPSHPQIAPRWDEATVVYDRGEPMDRNAAGIRTICQANLAGLPALSLPVGLARSMPVGLQLIGRPLDEGLVLRAAQAIEERAGFLGTTPPTPPPAP